MKRSPRSPRTPSNLSESTNHKLNMYALAARAAGVGLGLLALTQSAEAKIVYTATWAEITPGAKLALDLNHDGINDFSLSNLVMSTTRSFRDTFKVLASKNNEVWGAGSYAAALRAGVRIGPGKRFRPGNSLMATDTANCNSVTCHFASKGPWINVTGRYLGLKFSIKGKIHYGWARLDVTVTHGGVYAALTGYAYETVPNTPIVAGKTSGPEAPASSMFPNAAVLSVPAAQPRSLGWLAQGARVLDMWRKRDTTEE
jgi:hypothetical protein